ncbi:MAG: hypothetical protein ACRBBN_19905, partial [Methyloligellaceae bacterium]
MRKALHKYNLFIPFLLLTIITLLGTGDVYAQKTPSKKPKCSPLSMLVLFKKNQFPEWDGIFSKFKKSWPAPNEVKKTITKEGISISIQDAAFKKAPLFLSLSTSDKPVSRKFIDEAAIGTWWWRTAKQEVSR